MKSVDAMAKIVVDWICPLLPDRFRDPMNTAIKLAEEVAELQHSIYMKDGDAGQECADILILLVDVAYLLEIDLEAEFDKKMKINMAREWKSQKGALKHENAN